MISSVLSTALHPPSRFHCSKDPILIFGFGPRRSLVGRLRRVSDHRNMTRVDAFRGGDGAERGRLKEPEAVMGIGSLGIDRDVASGEIESVINRMSKWLVAGLFGLVILWKHDAETLWAATGSVINSCLSITLKQMLNHQRPVSALRSDPGMPSSHAQSIFYAAFYAIFSLVHWLGYNAFTMTVGTLILMSGSYLSWLRISQRLHTVSQVLVGTALGAMCGVTWHWLWHSFVQSAFISSVWIRILVVIGSAAFCLGFLIHVIQHWVVDER